MVHTVQAVWRLRVLLQEAPVDITAGQAVGDAARALTDFFLDLLDEWEDGLTQRFFATPAVIGLVADSTRRHSQLLASWIRQPDVPLELQLTTQCVPGEIGPADRSEAISFVVCIGRVYMGMSTIKNLMNRGTRRGWVTPNAQGPARPISSQTDVLVAVHRSMLGVCEVGV